MSTFGNTTVETQGTDTMPVGWMSAVKFTAPENGTVTKIDYYCKAETTGKSICFIYNDATKALLGTSEEIKVDQTAMWRGYILTAKIVAGTVYLLAFMGNVLLYTPYADGTTTQWLASGNLIYPNAPNPFKVDYQGNYKASIYATYKKDASKTYNFAFWTINDVEREGNPLTIEVNSDVKVIAVYSSSVDPNIDFAPVTFRGSISDGKAGEPVTVTVTNVADGSTETLITFVLDDKTYMVTGEFSIGSSYRAKVSVHADERYTACESAEREFSL